MPLMAVTDCTAIVRKGARAVIPNNPSRTRKQPLDRHLYAQRNLSEMV